MSTTPHSSPDASLSDREATSAGARSRSSAGLVYAIGANALWGILPLYFVALEPTGPLELVAWRIVFSLVFCVLVLTVMRSWRRLVAIVRRPRALLILGVSGVLIYVNWQTFIIGALGGHVVETALGYFITPIVTVFLGVFLFGERLGVTQWVAIGLAAAAVAVLAIGYGSVPWIALILAFSFGTYGYVKKRVGDRVDALSGLTIETAWLVPVAVVQLIVVGVAGNLTLGQAGPWHTVLLASAGVVTAVPLLLFAAGARRLPLVYMGFVQFVCPVLQFVVGVFILHEEMPLQRWIGFALVWAALIVLMLPRRRRA